MGTDRHNADLPEYAREILAKIREGEPRHPGSRAGTQPGEGHRNRSLRELRDRSRTGSPPEDEPGESLMNPIWPVGLLFWIVMIAVPVGEKLGTIPGIIAVVLTLFLYIWISSKLS